MKRYRVRNGLLILSVLAMVVSLASCGSKKNPQEVETTVYSTQQNVSTTVCQTTNVVNMEMSEIVTTKQFTDDTMQTTIRRALLDHVWYSDLQWYYAYQFKDNGTIVSYCLQDDDTFEKCGSVFYSYRISDNHLYLRWGSGNEIKLAYVKDTNGQYYFKEVDVPPEYLFEDGPGYCETWLKIRKEPLNIAQNKVTTAKPASAVKISEDEARALVKQYLLNDGFDIDNSYDPDGIKENFGLFVYDEDGLYKVDLKKHHESYYSSYAWFTVSYDGKEVKMVY